MKDAKRFGGVLRQEGHNSGSKTGEKGGRIMLLKERKRRNGATNGRNPPRVLQWSPKKFRGHQPDPTFAGRKKCDLFWGQPNYRGDSPWDLQRKD